MRFFQGLNFIWNYSGPVGCSSYDVGFFAVLMGCRELVKLGAVGSLWRVIYWFCSMSHYGLLIPKEISRPGG